MEREQMVEANEAKMQRVLKRAQDLQTKEQRIQERFEAIHQVNFL